jgi:hypothetical protein
MHQGSVKETWRNVVVVSTLLHAFVFLTLFSFYGRREHVIPLLGCPERCIHVHRAVACLVSIFLAGAPLREDKMRGESDRADARLRFREQMSQVASTGVVGGLSQRRKRSWSE